MLLATPALAVPLTPPTLCPTTAPGAGITSTGDSFVAGDQAYIVAPSLTGLYFEDHFVSTSDSVSVINSNGADIDTTGMFVPGIEFFGEFDSICYDGQGGSIVSDDSGVTVNALSDGNVLLNIAHDIDAGFVGVEVAHGGDGLIDITTSTITADDAGVLVQRFGAGNTNITANGAINAGDGPGIVVLSGGDGNITIDAKANISSTDSGIAVQHYGDSGDISITTSAGTTISAHGGPFNGPPYFAQPGLSGTAGIYVDRAAFGFAPGTGDITVTNGANIDVDAMGIYIDVCGCVDSNILVNSTGTITVGEGYGIYVVHETGNTAVNQSGKVTVTDGTGVVIEQNDDGDVVASLTGGVDATDGGLVVEHAADGTIAVSAGGTYKVTDGSGIEVYHDGAGAVGITSTATITSKFDAILVEQNDGGAVTVNQTGKLTVADGSGIMIDQAGSGDVNVAMIGDINASESGIDVEHDGLTGTITIATSTGSTISATGGGFLGGTGIMANRSNLGPGTGAGGIVITNGANIVTDSVGIFASLCDCSPGDISIASTGTIDVNGLFGGAGLMVLHDGTGTVTVNAPGRIAVTGAGFGMGMNISKSGPGAINVTAGEITASTTGISIAAIDPVDIDIDANGKITTPAGVGIAVNTGGGSLDVAAKADVDARDAGMLINHTGPSGNIDVTASGGKLTASGGTMMLYGTSPITGSAGIHLTQTGSGKVTITNGDAIEADGVGIYADTKSTTGGLSIVSSGSITAPYGIYATTSAGASLSLNGGTIKGTHGVTLAGAAITGNLAAGAKIEVNGSGAGRYGASFTGTTNLTIAGTVDAPGTDALLFTGGNATLTLLPGFVINGNVDALASAQNDLIFAGATGDASFDLDRLGTVITDFDTFLKTGNSTWTFSGAAFSGLLTANAGTVVINSNIPGLDLVLENTTFHGNAGLKSLTTSGGTLAPGNSIGLITVVGDASIGAGTVYGVEVNAAGASDKLSAGGTVTIDPTASVLASMEPGSFGAVTKYTIITGTTAVSGAFSGVNSVSAFYDATLSYDANNAYLTLSRNALTLGDFALTPNEKATAAALDAAGKGAPYFDELLVLPADEVPGALDSLSGDGYASLTAATLDDSRFVRDAALDRRGARGIWSTPYGGVAHLPGDGNGPAVDHATGGLLLGADGPVGDGYLGVLLGYGQSHYAIPTRDMTATSGEFNLGSYGGADWNQFYASFGAAITGRDIDATREVAFPGVSDIFRAQYASLTTQAFGELGFRLEAGSTTITPFGGLAGLHTTTTGYAETGSGAGALTVDPSAAAALVATLGLRVEHDIALNDDTTLTLRASAAWKHAMGKASTSNSMAGTGAFTVAGAPLPADTLTVTAGAGLDMGQLAVGLDYTGSLGSGGKSNALTATLAGQF